MHTGPVIQCAQCGGAIVAPEWSEHRSERCVRNVWSCECGYRFEHTVYFFAPKIQPDLRVKENKGAACAALAPLRLREKHMIGEGAGLPECPSCGTPMRFTKAVQRLASLHEL